MANVETLLPRSWEGECKKENAQAEKFLVLLSNRGRLVQVRRREKSIVFQGRGSVVNHKHQRVKEKAENHDNVVRRISLQQNYLRGTRGEKNGAKGFRYLWERREIAQCKKGQKKKVRTSWSAEKEGSGERQTKQNEQGITSSGKSQGKRRRIITTKPTKQSEGNKEREAPLEEVR